MRAEPHPSQPQTEAPHAGHNYPPLYSATVRYVEVGLSVIPTDPKTKAPIIPWKDYQTRLPTGEEVAQWFITKGFQGLGIICGAVSGGMEILDFDHNAALYEQWLELVEEEAPGLTSRLVVQKTQHNGRHVGYRCNEVTIPGNLKLAAQPMNVTHQVLAILRDSKIDPADRGAVKKALSSIGIEIAGKRNVPMLVDGKFVVILTMVETRGTGGQFLAAPSPGYELLQGDFTAIPIITAEERQILVNAALALNEVVDPVQTEGIGNRRPKGTERPGDAFNETGDVVVLLEKHAWTRVSEAGNYQHWRRPGKTRGQSASLIDSKIFKMFTTNAHPFEAEKAYSPFAVYTLLEHNGDYVAAARELYKQGYGESGATGGDWPEPEPLRRTPDPGEPFPVEALGPILGDAAGAMHGIIKAPLAVCGQSVLAALNLAVQGHADVVIDGRWFPVSENFLSIAETGERKSAADKAALTPVDAHQRLMLEAYDRDFSQYNLEAALWKKEYEDALRKKDHNIRRADLEALPAAPTAPPYPQLTTEEPTYEGLVKLLAQGWPSVGLFSDEAGRFLGGHAMNQENRLKTLAGLSNTWDGKPITRTRAGDGASTLYGRRVCAHLLMQPLVAETILSDPMAHNQGFLSRCLISAPESTLGTQSYVAKDLSIEASYGIYCTRLTQVLNAKLPFKIDPDTGKPMLELIPRKLPVSSDGKEIWIRSHDWVQGHLGRDGVFRPISGIAAKAAEHALRLAGTLSLVEDLNATAISPGHVKAGIVLARFYLTEALRLFHSAKTDPDLLLAEKVFTWLKTRGGSRPQLVSLPCVYQTGPNAVRDKATAARCMAFLADHGWVRLVEGGAEIAGKKRRQVWEVHPDV